MRGFTVVHLSADHARHVQPRIELDCEHDEGTRLFTSLNVDDATVTFSGQPDRVLAVLSDWSERVRTAIQAGL